MRKKQFIGAGGVDVDIYVENQHGLKVPYYRLAALSAQKGDMRGAWPEHLIVLKLDAAKDRSGTAKGEKDQQDILNLLTIPNNEFKNPQELGLFLDKEDWKKLGTLIVDVGLTERYERGHSRDAKALKDYLKSKFEHLYFLSQNPKESNLPILELQAKDFNAIFQQSTTDTRIMIRHRFHQPNNLVSICQLARMAGLKIPFVTNNPTMVEVGCDIEKTESEDSVYKNFPTHSYSVPTRDSYQAIYLLAYIAFDWQAREIMKAYNYSHFSEKQKKWADESGCFSGCK